ncbi:MAG: amidohydrolase 2 [Eubacterium sp.]|nr:amidohydrolase 2 [Eubacterium sp.]
MVNNIEIIDSHVHTFANDDVAGKIISSFNKLYDIEFTNPGNGTIDNVLKNMKQGGIDRTVMVNFAPPKIIHRNNLWTLEAAKNSEGKLIPLVSFHPEMEGSITEHLENYISLGAKGIKLHPMAQGFDVRDKRLDDLYECCNHKHFAILIHCGRVSNARLNEYSDFECILPVIEKYPELPIILAHMADGDAELCLEVSKKYKNIYFDTSIVITGYPEIMDVNEPSWLDDEEVAETINRIGADKVIFGSDFPWGSPIHDLERINKLKLSEDQKKLIFNGNAMRLFNLD